MIVDVDGLKPVDDSDGRAAGDELLRTCARLLSDNTRAHEVGAQVGGDEFAALLRYSDEQAAAPPPTNRLGPGRRRYRTGDPWRIS